MPTSLASRNVIVLSPSDFSLYTLSTVASLHRAGIGVAGVGLRRLVNPRRLLSEHRRDGRRLLKKIWIKLVRRAADFHVDRQESISHFLKQNDIQLESVSAFCRRQGIPVRYCYDFNEKSFVTWVEHRSPDALVFTGGGLIRENLLGVAPKGILNCHMGILPPYRGMDLPEWAILNGDLGQVGCCVHRMDSGVDTGPVLRNYEVPLRTGDDIRMLRNRIEYTMCRAIVDSTVDYLEGRITPQPQAREDGKQFFIMAPDLIEVVETRLNDTRSA